MENVLKLADEISDIIKNSKTFMEYKAAYNRIKDKPEIMDRINKMKREHIDFAHNYKGGNYDFDREKYIAQEFYKLMLDKDVETYFMNEHKLVSLLSDIYGRISNDCVLWVFDGENV